MKYAILAVFLLAATPGRYGAPVYSGAAAGAVTAQFYHVGGEAGGFSSVRALNALYGEPAVTAETAKLRTQYGDGTIDQFYKTFDYVVNDAWSVAGRKNVTFGTAGALDDASLARRLESLGTAADGTFWCDLMFDNLVTNGVMTQVGSDVDARYGEVADGNLHRVCNQLIYDLASKNGASVKLAPFH